MINSEKSMLATWFLVAATISAIPLFLEYSKVQRKYDIIKIPRHRHLSGLPSNALPKHRNRHSKVG